MPSLEFESGIRAFLELGRAFAADGAATGGQVLDVLTRWYRDVRINEAAVETKNDMLLLQWGATKQMVLSGPTDLRGQTEPVKWTPQNVRFLDFTRQVFPEGDDPDAEFDDAAVQMSILLGFGPADGSEKAVDLWIARPEDIEREVPRFLAVPFVAELMALPARTASVSVDRCG